ncbi:FAD-binding protein [Leucobacter sp. CSA1]|uniref:FAD-binding protein n=1 Tax=Leucobacter chromiisoli TaxID=2796471 RepID=A0A934UUT0_9MICO|nr:D-arabinono-1,4-lactone oxidase [Leucobacter chromiisoli]MBK0418503.1 FAD-binding protein [Leucobacter chromiisoli]
MTRIRRNWARTETFRPALTVAPRSTEQVVLAVRRGLETGHGVKPLGATHSFSGVAATDGIHLDMDRMRGAISIDRERGRATVWGGTRLRELAGILNPHGLALPNMGDIDRQTIAGAIQTGTHGTGLRQRGLAAGVVGATIVTGTGEVLEVDEQHHPELLPAVALGLGALGVIVAVTLQCAPRFLLRAEEAPEPLDAALDDFVERTRSADHFEFFWFPHTEVARTKTNTRLPLDAPLEPLGAIPRLFDEEVMNNQVLGAILAVERLLPPITPRVNRLIAALSSRRSYSDESHRVFVTPRRVRFIEMEYGLPLDAVPAAVRELRDMIERRGHRVSFPVEVRAAAADDLPTSTAYGRESGYVSVHRYWRESDSGYFRDAEDILLAHGGRPHWGKLHTQGVEELRRIYPRLDDFLAIRDRLDPDRVFANPYLDRVLGR